MLLSRATSLTVNGISPKSIKTPKIPLKVRAKDKIPNLSASK